MLAPEYRVEVRNWAGVHVRRHLCPQCAAEALAIATGPEGHLTTAIRVVPDSRTARVELYPPLTFE